MTVSLYPNTVYAVYGCGNDNVIVVLVLEIDYDNIIGIVAPWPARRLAR